MNQDAEHLRLLSIFHYVVAGLVALFACFPVCHVVFGLVTAFSPNVLEHIPEAQPEGLRIIGLFFAIVASVFILFGWAMAFCIFLAGRYLHQCRHYTFCLVMAGIMCMFIPFGTVLGVFTIIVLMRPSVKEMFAAAVPV